MNLELAQHFGSLDHGSRRIDLKDHFVTAQMDDGPADFETLAVVANHPALFEGNLIHKSPPCVQSKRKFSTAHCLALLARQIPAKKILDAIA
jgi:hypothetical protein